MESEGRKISESIVETVHVVRPEYLNMAGRLFGGVLMQWIDEVAGVVAGRHSRLHTTTASVNDLEFLQGAYLGDLVVIKGKVTYVGNTSMEIKVDTFVEKRDGKRVLINCAYFTMVALDKDERPATVPRIVLETDEEREEWERAKLRREMRKLRKKEGF